MKRSTSRCKKSRFSKCSLASKRHLRSLGILALLLANGCQVNRGRGSSAGGDAAGVEAIGEPLAVRPPLAPPPPPFNVSGPRVRLWSGEGPLHGPLAELAMPGCEQAVSGPLQLRMRTTLKSSFGSHVVDIALRGNLALVGGEVGTVNDTVRAEVEGVRLSFASSTPLVGQLRTKACAALTTVEEGPAKLVLDRPALDQMREWLEMIAPDCQRVEVTSAGFECRLPMTTPDQARQELAGIQMTMIRRWSRQPYLLARRVAVGLTLAHALQGEAVDHQLDTFCRILGTALPGELPATMASRRWQEAVCGPSHPSRAEAARFGLAKTVAEVDFMRQLFERTSRLGFLSLKIPNDQLPTKQILVSLTPEGDVADSLAREASRLWSIDGSPGLGGADESPRACWHPVYAESPMLLKLARQLAMAGDVPRLVCEEGKGQEVAAPFPSTERYFAESVTSETEFILINGRSKTLRLPTGRYTYTMRALPDDAENWDDASQQSPTATGHIVWDDRRPRPIISTW